MRVKVALPLDWDAVAIVAGPRHSRSRAASIHAFFPFATMAVGAALRIRLTSRPSRKCNNALTATDCAIAATTDLPCVSAALVVRPTIVTYSKVPAFIAGAGIAVLAAFIGVRPPLATVCVVPTFIVFGAIDP